MKKKIIFAAILLVGLVAGLMAQGPSWYVKTVPIYKVYSHRLGYKVLYEKSDLTLGVVYFPLRWFNESGGKGDLILGDDSAYPYFSIFYKEKEFSHVRLYLRESLLAASWGDLDPTKDISDQFKIDTVPDLEF